MSRYSGQTSYSHHIHRIDSDTFEISWMVDRYYSGSRLRFPRRFGRITDEAGAKRFCKRWDIDMPKAKGQRHE